MQFLSLKLDQLLKAGQFQAMVSDTNPKKVAVYLLRLVLAPV